MGGAGTVKTRLVLLAVLATLLAAFPGQGPGPEPSRPRPPKATAAAWGPSISTTRERLALRRTDQRIDFNWRAGSPSGRVRPDTFSALAGSGCHLPDGHLHLLHPGE